MSLPLPSLAGCVWGQGQQFLLFHLRAWGLDQVLYYVLWMP